LSREPDAANIAVHADAWIDVRDACPIGKGARYSDAQVRYHYTKDRAYLRVL
jgi:methylmalonic aciduria homocystinuria type C protein